MLLAAMVMAAAAGGACALTGGMLGDGKFGLLVSLGVSAGVGLAVYFLVCFVLRLEEARMAAGLLERIVKRG
jgi:hypothetical protein